MAAPQPTFAGLAATISENAQVLDGYLASSDRIPRPTLGPDSPLMFPAPPEDTEIHDARSKLLEALRELQLLALGPIQGLFRTVTYVITNRLLLY